MSKPRVTIYTDGSCTNNERGKENFGGFCAILVFGKAKKLIHDGLRNTTNNRMELMAIIAGIEALRVPCEVLIYTDSQYAIQVLRTYKSYLRGKPMKQKTKNKDLILRFALAAYQHDIDFCFIKGHNGHEMNEECDRLAASWAKVAIEEDKACSNQEHANFLITEYSKKVLFHAQV